jgi:large subunit ribosomal protein L19
MIKTDVAQLLVGKYGKKNPPAVKAGDTVRVHQKIKEGDKERVQIFEGLVIAVKHGRGLDGSFTVRKIAAGSVGVERTYPLHSPNVVKVERTKTAQVNRGKLYYMRDRKGKNARFKKEAANPASWEEPAHVELPVEEEPVAEVVVEETVAAVVEETVVEAAPQAAEEATAEAVEAPETAADEVEAPAAEEAPAEEPAKEEKTEEKEA